MKFIKHLSRILLGLTFMFSGFVKGIDPLGSAYKFTDYFNAMGLESLTGLALVLGILLSFAEFAIGVGLVFSIFMRFTSWLALLFMLFFTGLTLWIALENPVTDCGCFGDFLILTNWETFYKNIVLLVLALIVFFYRKTFKNVKKYNQVTYGLAILSFIIYIAAVIFSYNHLPIFDFRPYKVGTNIPKSMEIPEDAPQPIFENSFFYKNLNTGKIEEFTEDNYPWQDTLNYEYHDMKSVQVQEGYIPPIHDFSVLNEQGDNILDFYLYDENYVFMLIAYDLKKSSSKNFDKIDNLAEWALNNNHQFIGLTSSLVSQDMQQARPFTYYNADEITLKTIIRSNPGLLLIKNGDIIDKWHYNDIPTVEEFKKEYIK